MRALSRMTDVDAISGISISNLWFTTDAAFWRVSPALFQDHGNTTDVFNSSMFGTFDYTVQMPSDSLIWNNLASMIDLPTINLNPSLVLADGAAFIELALDDQPNAGDVPITVGVEILASDGTMQILQAQIDPGQQSARIELSDAMLRALAEEFATTVTVRLFDPSQAELANGDVEQSAEVLIGVAIGVGSDGDNTYTYGVSLIGFGGSGNDRVATSSRVDILFGGEGDDIILSADGNDRIDGGSGNDELYGAGGNDRLNGGDGDDFIDGGLDDDIIRGGSGNDILEGVFGDDLLYGGAGNDQIRGGVDNDMLDGGSGNDYLSGGQGSDIYVFGHGYDLDNVARFQDGDDLLLLTDFTEEEIYAAIANKTGDASRTILDFGEGDILILNGISIDDFGFEDILFTDSSSAVV